MADAAVEFLLGNLKDLLSYHAHLITDTKKNIEDLEIDLRLFNSYLQESQKRRRKDGPTRVLVQNIRDVVYEVEGVIDAFVTQALEKKSTSSLFKFWKPSVNLHEIGTMLEEVKGKVERARTDYANRSVHDEDEDEKPEVRLPRVKDVVGFEDVTTELTNRLTKETDYFDVVCLIGMFGLGKTTLAWKIFNDQAIFYEFPVRIWLPISQEFSNKDIFISILEHFTTITDEIRRKGETEIASAVASYLENGSFLIVFDDVWTTGDWERIRVCLPSNNKGKVLITSRTEDVGTYASHKGLPHRLRFFTEDESWELLRLEALRKLDCPRELEVTGRLIAEECEGLPLAVVIIGGILATKYWESDLGKTSKAWKEVSRMVNSYIKEDPKARMNKFIYLSYDKLPYHLRACFLYLGMFPEDYEIPAAKLILMWIGEGFIQKSNDLISLEATGEKYLEDLINRNLVRIEKFKCDGKIKTIRIHDALRDFCRTEAESEYENFLQEIKFIEGVFKPPVPNIKKYRRLCVHSHCPKFISLEPFGPCVRSFISIPKDEFTLSSENVPSLLKAFKLIRVFDAKPLRFPKFTKELFQLVHVRYMSLSVTLSSLPSKFSELWNLQTLIVDTTSRKLEVKADLLKLIQLRLFKTNASATLPKPTKDSKHGTELQTLGTISVESCTAEFFQKACNLKKLGIRGPLALLVEGKKGSLASLGEMKYLEHLKLINDIHPLPPSEGQLSRLPPHYHFPSRLKSLTIRGTSLDWSDMSTLGFLKSLEVLKLKGKAFIGKAWETEEGGFRLLEFLLIDDTDLVVWTASSSHFPKLRGLVLRHCADLTHVPLGLAEIATFKTLDLNTCQKASASAKKIQEVKKKAEADFKLSVFPPISINLDWV